MFNELDLPKELLEALEHRDCDLGLELFGDFRNACEYRKPVDCKMRYAFYSSLSRYLPEDECSLQGINVFIGVFARLRSTFLAWHFDRVEAAGENLFTINPTPIPEVPLRMKEEGIAKIMEELLSQGLPPEQAQSFAQERINEVKASMMQYLYREAKKATDKAKTAITDDMVEGRFLQEYKGWWEDFVTYNLAIMQFPLVETETKLRWVNGKLKPQDEIVVKAKRISPFDFWVTPDSTNAQDGKAVFVRSKVTYKTLSKLKGKAKGAVKENIDFLMNKGDPVIDDMWMYGVEKNENKLANVDTVEKIAGTWDMLKCWTKVSGMVLKEYGIEWVKTPDKKEVVEDEMYEIEGWMIAGRIVYIAPNYHPLGKRPFYTASWQPINGSVYGKSLYDTVASIEKAGNAAARDIMKNAAATAGYIAELDQSRFEEGAEPRAVQPWTLYRTAGYDVGGSSQALRFHTIPSKLGDLTNLHDWLSNEAQKASGIFDFMAGAASEVSSALRTNVGVSAVQGNGTKLINYRAITADKSVYQDLFTDWWTYLMVYSDDSSIKVDASVDVKGLASVTAQAELDSRAIALLQNLPNLMSATNEAGMRIDPRFVMSVVKAAAGNLGGDTSFLADPEAQDEIQRAVGAPIQGQPEAAMDGRSAVPQTPDEMNRLPV